jgi:hypothetical protein
VLDWIAERRMAAARDLLLTSVAGSRGCGMQLAAVQNGMRRDLVAPSTPTLSLPRQTAWAEREAG